MATVGRHRRIDYGRYAVVPIWYYCNSACTFCMVERQLGHLPGISPEGFRRVIETLREEGKYDCLILSGGEVTTFPNLANYVRMASELGWFQTIQIQTNARRLADEAYCRQLIGAGVNEFFVSVHGIGEVQDAITQAPGGFAETRAGIDHIAQGGANLITNTVLTRDNFEHLPDLFRYLCKLPVSEMHLWNYFPMAGTDSRNLLVNMKEFYWLLPDLLAIVEAAGKPLVLKGFPECLSLGEPGYFDSQFPVNLIDQAFWDNFDENQFGCCPHRQTCRAKGCFGLSGAYVQKFGPEADLLNPRS